MKFVDVVDLTKKAVAQTLGDSYMEENGYLNDIPSGKLVDIGKAIDAVDNWSAYAINAVSLLGKHVIDNRLYNTRLPKLYVDAFDWGGFLERTRFGLGDIMADPMYNLQSGTSYADIEHTYYDNEAKTKIYNEAKAIMTPLSIVKEQLKEAFKSWEDMGKWLSGKQVAVKNTINIALKTYEQMLLSCAVAISDRGTDSAVHFITEATQKGIIPYKDDTTTPATMYEFSELKGALTDEQYYKFLVYVSSRISKIREYMYEPSTAYNDGTVPTWCVDDPNLLLLTEFERDVRFYMKASTFNKDDVEFGEYDTIAAWQGIKTENGDDFGIDAVSSIEISADATNKIGIGTNGYTVSGVVGLLYDPMAIGISLQRNKVTSSYTACADFWNEFHHTLINYILDSSYGMVALIMD